MRGGSRHFRRVPSWASAGPSTGAVRDPQTGHRESLWNNWLGPASSSYTTSFQSMPPAKQNEKAEVLSCNLFEVKTTSVRQNTLWEFTQWPVEINKGAKIKFTGLIHNILNTVWKFHVFSITQILCEINFGHSRSTKSTILTHLEVLNFDEILHFLECWNLPN